MDPNVVGSSNVEVEVVVDNTLGEECKLAVVVHKLVVVVHNRDLLPHNLSGLWLLPK